MNIELKQLELDWPAEVSVLELKNYVLSKLNSYGEPLRWAITALTNNQVTKTQKILIEAVLIIHQDQGKGMNTTLN